MIIQRRSAFCLCLTLATVAPIALARNVDLSTIPSRDSVQLTIYNSEDLTLVRETRHVTFAAGNNPLQFSWANTLIDPTSVHLRFRSHAEDLDIVDTTFPHSKPQMLYWNVKSAFDGDAEVEITYFTSGITWAADYVCISDSAEEKMTFEGFVRISNNSGEDYENAQVRLVVGEINLVEKIDELARRGLVPQSEADAFRRDQLKYSNLPRRAREVMDMELGRMFSAPADGPKKIIKEGLSEYFIYTVEGTETVGHGGSKRLRLFWGETVPFEIKYRYRPAEYGDQLTRLFVLRNDEKSGLGTTPLPNGIVRLFRDNRRDGLSFLTAYSTKYVPIGQEIELNLGADPEVIHERVRLRSWRDDFWFLDAGRQKYYSPEHGDQIRRSYTVAGWDDHERWVERIRNYRDKPIDVEIRRRFDGHVIFTSSLDVVLHDYRTPQLTTRVKSGGVGKLRYEVTLHQGMSAKQNNVTLAREE